MIGTAAAGIRRYRYIDENGKEAVQEFDDWVSHARVRQCIEITFAFHVVKAWAKAEGNILYWKD